MKQTYLIQSLKNPLKIGPPSLFGAKLLETAVGYEREE